MNRFISLLIFTLFFSSQSFAENLFSNSNFSLGPREWLFDHGGLGGYSISQDAHSGSRSFMVEVESIGKNPWDIQLKKMGFPVEEGKIYRLSFWAKSVDDGEIYAAFTKASPNWDYYGGKRFFTTNSWQKFTFDFISPVTTKDIQATFHTGIKKGTYFFDTFEFVEIASLPQPDNNWLELAEERIDSLRKRDFSIKVVDKNGEPISNSYVLINLKSHQFSWGTAMALYDESVEDELWYREKLLRYFNCGVIENDFKWANMERVKDDPVRANVQRYIDFADENNWDIRAHTLIWGGERWIPPWLNKLSPDNIVEAVRERIIRDVTYYKGHFREYDVINEPIHETWLANTVGDSINVLAFKWAKEADPNATLYINEYNIISGNATIEYRELIEDMLKKGAPIDGIGVQGHFNGRVNWRDVVAKLDYISEIGLPIKITELDIKNNTTHLAEDYAKIMRIAFSHPQVEGLLWWGFWDYRHWLAGAGIYDVNKNKKPAADTLFNLIQNHWTTSKKLKTDDNGEISFRGFAGFYDIEVDKSTSQVSLLKENSQILHTVEINFENKKKRWRIFRRE